MAADASFPISVYEHGQSGARVIVLHGGPAAAGDAAALARGLSSSFRVLEPWQRASGDVPLTVARHVADLHEVVAGRCIGEKPALVGHSWGAMLALAYAAEHPDGIGPIALIGCGTFDLASRAEFRRVLDARMAPQLRDAIDRLSREIGDANERTLRIQKLLEPIYQFDPAGESDEIQFDLVAHEQTWRDMLRLQELGVYPAAFGAIRSRAIMVHGDYDPHPGRMIHGSLRRYLPQLQYMELARCGHTPWRESMPVRQAFMAALTRWLAERAG